MEYRVTKKERRKTTEVEMRWEIKDDLAGAKKAQSSHSSARKAALKGQNERPILSHPFPATGSLRYSAYWQDEARRIWSDADRNPRDFPDSTLIANHVRKLAKEQSLEFDDPKIQKLLENILKKWQ